MKERGEREGSEAVRGIHPLTEWKWEIHARKRTAAPAVTSRHISSQKHKRKRLIKGRRRCRCRSERQSPIQQSPSGGKQKHRPINKPNVGGELWGKKKTMVTSKHTVHVHRSTLLLLLLPFCSLARSLLFFTLLYCTVLASTHDTCPEAHHPRLASLSPAAFLHYYMHHVSNHN